jgi:hypothetical protein
MVLAEAQTTASTGAIWAIIIVATVALAFWLIAINLADRSQVRASGPAPAPAGAPAGGRVSGEQAEEMPNTAVHEPLGVPAQGRPAPDESAPEGDIPTRADLPAQRRGDADRAARSHAARDDEEPGR